MSENKDLDLINIDGEDYHVREEGNCCGCEAAQDVTVDENVKFRNAASETRKYPPQRLDQILECFDVVADQERFEQFLISKLEGFTIPDQETVLNNAFQLASAVVRIIITSKRKGMILTYHGTGTVFSMTERSDVTECVVYTSRHNLLLPDDHELQSISVESPSGKLLVVSSDWITYSLYMRNDFAIIRVPSSKESLFPNKFPFVRPATYEIDRMNELLQIYPTKESDSGYLFVVIGYPKGLLKRVSVLKACKRIHISTKGAYLHRAPTFRGNSGSMVFAIPIGFGDDGMASARNMAKQVPSTLKCLAGIHYGELVEDCDFGAFVSLVDLLSLK